MNTKEKLNVSDSVGITIKRGTPEKKEETVSYKQQTVEVKTVTVSSTVHGASHVSSMQQKEK